MQTVENKLRASDANLPFPSLLGAAEWAGYQEERLVSLSPSRLLREEEAARYLASIGAEWEDTQHGPVVRFPKQ